jgi:predicted enzyme related to lactoylglutathione lyase
MIHSAFPILSTTDLSAALRFYRDALGGVVSYQFPPDGEPEYVGVDLGSSQVGLAADTGSGDGPMANRWSLWVYVDDCDACVRRLRDAGTPIVGEPADQPWGERIARVHDPDGNVVIIGSPPPAPASPSS